MTVTGEGLATSRISWFFDENSTELEVFFSLTVSNLNDTSIEPMHVSGIEDQYYLLTIRDTTSCEVYSFQVAATSNAGSSNFSAPVSSTFPSVPDISPLESSLQYSIVQRTSSNGNDEIILSVSFDVSYIAV